MSTASLRSLGLVAIGVLLTAGGARLAGSRAPREASSTPIPTAPSITASSSSGSARLPRAPIVVARLTERVGSATLDAPDAAAAKPAFDAHWRRMQAPWIGPAATAPLGRSVQLVALRTSDEEHVHTVQTSRGEVVAFDARKWNMSEGAFEQREALVALGASTWHFSLRVPSGAALEVAPAVLDDTDRDGHRRALDVRFIVQARVGSAAPIALARSTVTAGQRNRWLPMRVDLAALAERDCELTFTTEAMVPAGVDAVSLTRAEGDSAPRSPSFVGLWGTPTIVQTAETALPYSVLWIVIDALRPDVLASFHDEVEDRRKLGAPIAPGYALLPKLEGLTPHIDALAARGVVYRHAYSAAPWTRPGTLAMLSGAHGTALGVSPLPWSLPDPMIDAYYAGAPPLLPVAFRRAGAATRAFVNNNFMLGYAQVGLDMGFEEVSDFRYRTEDTAHVLAATLADLRAHPDERAFRFVNFNSPHDPYDPTPECLARIPAPAASDASVDERLRAGPRDSSVRAYMAEACKDDAAVGAILAELDRLGQRDRTLVVLTADHGETLSDRHEMRALDLDDVTTRFHHAFGHFEETTRIPILLSLPGVLPEGRRVDAPVINLDLATTIEALEGLPRDRRQEGVDLRALAEGAAPPDRALVTLGRASQAIIVGKWRYVLRDEPARRVRYGHGDEVEEATIKAELFDLEADPGEAHSVASDPANHATLMQLHQRLLDAVAAIRSASTAPLEPAGAPASNVETGAASLRVRFAAGPGRHRFSVHAEIPEATALEATAIGAPQAALIRRGTVVELAGALDGESLAGLDLRVTPPLANVRWSLAIDDKPLDDAAVHAGPLGLGGRGLAAGITSADARRAAASDELPFIDPALDFGAFVIRQGGVDRAGAATPERVQGGAAQAEIAGALRQWGYAK